MESVGFLSLLYIMFTLPDELGIGELPWGKLDNGGLLCEYSFNRSCFGLNNVADLNTGYSLHLPRCLVSPFLEPQHVAYWTNTLVHGWFIPVVQCCFNWWISGGIRTENSGRMDCSVRICFYWLGHLVLGTNGQHISR